MKRSVMKAACATGFLLIGTAGWTQTAAQQALADQNNPQVVQLSISPTAEASSATSKAEVSSANPNDPTREQSLFLHLKGMGGDLESEQVIELFYGFEGIYNDGGMQIMGIKGDTRAVFAQRIQVLSNHPKVAMCALDEFGEHLNITVSGMSVASVMDLIMNVTGDQK